MLNTFKLKISKFKTVYNYVNRDMDVVYARLQNLGTVARRKLGIVKCLSILQLCTHPFDTGSLTINFDKKKKNNSNKLYF